MTGIVSGVKKNLCMMYKNYMASPSIALEWVRQQRVMNSVSSDYNPSIAKDSSGNIYVSYQTSGTVSSGTRVGNDDIVVFKMNTNGNVLWIKQQTIMNTTSSDTRPSIAVNASGNVYVSYQSTGTVSGGTFLGLTDVVVFKMDTNGNMIWIKQQAIMNSTGDINRTSIDVDDFGNAFVCHNTSGTISGGTFLGINDIVVFKLNTDGNMVWIKQERVMNTTANDAVPRIKLDSSGNVYISYNTFGGTVSSGTQKGSSDIVVFKMDTNGNMVWIKQQPSMNSSSSNAFSSIGLDSSGNIYLSYYTDGTVSGGTFLGSNDIVVSKMDSSGNVVWTRQRRVMNTVSTDENPSIAVDSSGNVYVTHHANGTVSGGTSKGSYDIVLFKMDTNGNLVTIIQEPLINTSVGDYDPRIAIDSNGNIFLTYYTSGGTVSGGILSGSDDIVVAKFTQPGLATPPGAPTAVSAVAGNGQATVSFTAPTNTGGADITSYTVTSSPGAFTGTGASSPIIVTGLTNGTAYTFTVTATNSAGTSAASSASVAVTPFGVPDAPTAVTATAESLCALVSWTKPANNGGSVITSYTVTSSPGSFTATVNGEDNTSCYVYGLTNGTAYTFTVTATNAAGTGAASSASGSVTPTANAPTTAVTDAVSSGNTASITTYVSEAPASTPTEQATLSIDMRTSLNAGTVGATTQQKVDTKLAYIDSMRAKVGADNFTVPQAQFTEFLQTFTTVAAQTLAPKPIVAYVPQYTASTATVDVSSASSASYFMVEVPIGYTAVLQNGAASISLTYNGTNYSDGTNTYNAGAVIVLGNKTLTLIGIGSGGFDVQETSQVICITKGAMIQTPSGEAPIETLRTNDRVLTGDGRIVPITNMKQIVVVAATKVNAPYVIERGAFGPGLPPMQLEVSPRHALQLRPGLWDIPLEAAKVNHRVYQNTAVLGKQVVYYHLSLPNYATDTVVANGLVTEVLNDGKVKELYVWNEHEQAYVRKISHIPNYMTKGSK
jgi:hypothetical protein